MKDSYGRVEILLVDDSPTDAELCIRTLKNNNLANEITWVKDGEQALDFLFARGEFAGRTMEQPPKVVLLDLRLPKVDGLEVLRQVRADERLKSSRSSSSLPPRRIATSSKATGAAPMAMSASRSSSMNSPKR